MGQRVRSSLDGCIMLRLKVKQACRYHLRNKPATKVCSGACGVVLSSLNECDNSKKSH
ncbi:hypothetical protein [Phormidesmis sp. 146-12]